MKKASPFEVLLDEVPAAGYEVATDLDRAWLDPLVGPAYEPVGGAVRLEWCGTRDGAALQVRGELLFGVRFECSRCGERVEREARCRVNSLHVPEASHRLRLDVDSEDGELDELYTFEGKKVDVEQAFVDAVAFALEPYPVCGDECRCPGEEENSELPVEAAPAPAWKGALAQLRGRVKGN